ncbi:MAG: hypothetical protein WC728_09360 [Elusimicrobiota bacterium]
MILVATILIAAVPSWAAVGAESASLERVGKIRSMQGTALNALSPEATSELSGKGYAGGASHAPAVYAAAQEFGLTQTGAAPAAAQRPAVTAASAAQTPTVGEDKKPAAPEEKKGPDIPWKKIAIGALAGAIAFGCFAWALGIPLLLGILGGALATGAVTYFNNM